VAFGMRDEGAEAGLARSRAGAELERRFRRIERAGTQTQLEAVRRFARHVVDDAADRAQPVTQRRRALQHLDAAHPLNARVVIAPVTDEKARRDGRTVLEDQRLVIGGAQAANADVRDDRGLLLRLDRNARHGAQRFLRGARLLDAKILGGHDRYGARLPLDSAWCLADDDDRRQISGLIRFLGLAWKTYECACREHRGA